MFVGGQQLGWGTISWDGGVVYCRWEKKLGVGLGKVEDKWREKEKK